MCAENVYLYINIDNILRTPEIQSRFSVALSMSCISLPYLHIFTEYQ